MTTPSLPPSVFGPATRDAIDQDDYRQNLTRAIDQDEDSSDQLAAELPAGTSLQNAATAAETPERRLPGRRCRVTLEDPADPSGDPLEPVVVRVDNRDYLAWDRVAAKRGWVKKKDDAVPVFLMSTFLAFAAMTRQGLTTLTWTQFELACLEAENLEETAEDLTGPTQ